MLKQSLPAVSTLTAETLPEFKTADNVVVVAYLDAEDKASSDIFSAIGDAERDTYLFGVVNDAALAEADGVKAPGLVVYKKFDDKKDVYDGKFVEEDILTFVKTAAVPLVGEIGPQTYSGYMSSGLPLAYIFSENAEERTELADALRPIALKYKGLVNFGTIDAKMFGAHAANLNLKEGVFPAFAIQDISKNQKFPFSQEEKITETAVADFVKSYVDGSLKPSVKSEPIPESNDGPVTVIVANNYQDIVIDNEKDVLVEFYAPWCGHCKSLAPKYEELGALYAAHSGKVTVAKVDATANDVPDEIQGFPTLKLFAAGKKDAPITYKGPRTVEDLAKFIAENGTHGIAAAAAEEVVEDIPESIGEAAAAATKSAASVVEEATEAVKSKASEASEAVKSAVGSDDTKDEL